MAEMEWTRPIPAARPAPVPLVALRRIAERFFDWEVAITLLLTLGAATAVSSALESGGWSKNMPPITTVTACAVIGGMLLARTRLSMLLAWPLGLLTGAAVTFWQTLVLVGPGTLEQRIDSIYYRFSDWFNVAFGTGVTNDQLPFNTLVIGLTWIGVFIFSWSVFRWHNAWIGLIPGGAALFVDIAFVGDDLTGAVVLYVLLGMLLVMRTNLMGRIARWRAEGIEYPQLISITFLHFSLWAVIGLMSLAWVMPTGPFATPAPVQSLADRVVRAGADIVRLAGPLQSNKIIPIHSYSGVLPFQGSIKLGDRQLLAVTVTDPRIDGPLLLRGAVYDRYEGGGWTLGERDEVELPPGTEQRLRGAILEEELAGTIVPLHVDVTAKSVVGTVIFSAGQPISSERPVTVGVPQGALRRRLPDLPAGGRHMTDNEVLASLDEDMIGARVVRNVQNAVTYVEVFDANDAAVLDAINLDPGRRIRRGQSYDVTGFFPGASAEDLRAAGTDYPGWVERNYLQLPEESPASVAGLAQDIQSRLPAEGQNPYDTAKAIEAYIRANYPDVSYNIPDTPAGRDTVEFFLFDTKQGYFDYHASAMVVMLRHLGIPSRLAVGFLADESDIDNITGAYAIRDSNSYAWPEVYFPEYGWFPFNPTPDHPANLTPVRNENSLEDDLLDLNNAFPGLPVSATEGFFIPEPDTGTASGISGSGLGASEGGGPPWLLLAVIAAFAAALYGAVQLGWQRAVAGLPYPQQMWEKTVRLASWAGHPPREGQTPHEYAAALGRRYHIKETPDLASAYTRSRFGRKETTPEDAAKLREFWPDLRGALLRSLAGRVLRRRTTPLE